MPWHVKGSTKVLGPLSSSDLQALAGSGRLTASHLVSKNASGPWAKAGGVRGLVFCQRFSIWSRMRCAQLVG